MPDTHCASQEQVDEAFRVAGAMRANAVSSCDVERELRRRGWSDEAAADIVAAVNETFKQEIFRHGLPPPLADPLRALRPLANCFLISTFLLSGAIGVLTGGGGVVTGMLLLPQFCQLLFVWEIFPRQRVNAFFFRSFQNDRATGRLRTVVQQALGDDFRLSGIRSPRRRIPFFLRVIANTAFALHYATPRFMNLEAGRNWKARLWRSLADARCAFVDVSDLTPFVEEEIHLCFHCLGAERVLFLTGDKQSIEEARSRLASLLAITESDAQLLRITPATAGGRLSAALSHEVIDFRKRLPASVPGLNMDYVPRLRSATVPPHETMRGGILGLVSIVAGLAFLAALGVVRDLGTSLGLKLPLAAVCSVFIACVVVTYFEYLVWCGCWKKRIIALMWPLSFTICVFSIGSLMSTLKRILEASGHLQ